MNHIPVWVCLRESNLCHAYRLCPNNNKYSARFAVLYNVLIQLCFAYILQMYFIDTEGIFLQLPQWQQINAKEYN